MSVSSTCHRARVVSKQAFPQEVEEQLLDEDNDDVYGLSRVADVLHALLSAYRHEFYPHLDTLLPHLLQLLAQGRPYSDRQWAICIFDDVIEFGGECTHYVNLRIIIFWRANYSLFCQC